MAKGVCRASISALSGDSGADPHSHGKERGFTPRNPSVHAVIAPAAGSGGRVNRPQYPRLRGPVARTTKATATGGFRKWAV